MRCFFILADMKPFNRHTPKIAVAAILCLLAAACTHSAETQKTASGIVRIKTEMLDSLNRVSPVLNPVTIENAGRAKIDSLNYFADEECFRFANDIEARAYYPEHSVICFDGQPATDGRYKILVNDEWHYINSDNDFAEYLSWEKFLLDVVLFFDIEPDRNLYCLPDSGSDIISIDRQDIYFQPLKVEGDWIYADIIKGEEIFSPVGRCWIRWRSDNELLLKTLYFTI